MTTRSWVAKLDKKEHKNWVMVGCALNITKDGITQLIQMKVEAWYQSLISSPALHSLPPCTCARHSSKCTTCTTWKKELVHLHKSPRPKICWDNSDRQQWGSPAGAWEIAKVFMPTLGTRKGDVTDASTTDIGGLLNMLEWCPFINPPVNRKILSAVRSEGRNHWAHSPKQELQDAEVKTIFGHFNSLLNDPVFNADKAVQESSKDLQDLFRHGLVSVKESEVEALHLLRQLLVADLTKCKHDLTEVQKQCNENREDTVELKEQLAGHATELHAARHDLGKDQNDLLEAQESIRHLALEIRRTEECTQRDVSELKEQGEFHQEEIAKHDEQLGDALREVEDLKKEISMLSKSVENFNSLVSDRDDLRGGLQVISKDLVDVEGCLDSVVVELNTTKCKMVNLEVSLESMKSEVKEVTSEVETLKAKSSNEQRDENFATLCTAPHRLQEFTGRESALVWLEQKLVSDRDLTNSSSTSCCTKTICGLGGCGKTSLAVEFAWRSKNHFTGGVFWINGESDENVRKSVVENLALLNMTASTSENVDDSLNSFLALLSNKNCPWLLVVDNADELTSPKCPIGVKKIFLGPWQRNKKAPKNGHILFTTRQNVKDIKTSLRLSPRDCWEVQCFSKEESALFLTQRTGLEGESSYKEATDLGKELGGLPLALEQAAAYISALPIPCTFKAYLDKYRDVKLRLLEQQLVTPLSLEAQHRLSVHTTWEMNFEFIAEKSPAAATMMRIASFLESENIPFEVINPGIPALDEAELREAARSEIDIAAVVKVLTCYSLFSADQRSRVFSIHKLVQEVVRDSLTTQIRTETLIAAMRVLNCALRKKSESCLRFEDHCVVNWLEVNEEDKNTLIALLMNLRKLKDHLHTEMNLSKDRFIRCIGSDDAFGQLFIFSNQLIELSIFLVRLKAEFSEFLSQVQRMCCGEDPNKILDMMVKASVNKRNCSDSVSYKKAKELAEETVQKLHELENSGAIVNDDVKFRVFALRASYYALEGEWEKNHKALIKLESLRLSAVESVNLQILTARAENQVSACNFEPALQRHKYALRLARELQPPDRGLLLRALQHIAMLLYNERKFTEAKPYAEEMLDVCKTMPHDSDFYIKGMTDALKVLCRFDRQKSEAMLLKMLEERWPRIYTSVINGSTETSEVIIEDGSDDHAAGVLEVLVECCFIAHEKNPAKQMHLTAAGIALTIRKKYYGEKHPGLKNNYMVLISVHSCLGNVAEAEHCKQLMKQCDTRQKEQFHQGVPPSDINMYGTRKLRDLGKISFKHHDFDRAYELYTKAISLSPNDAKLLTNRAATSLKLSEKQRSREDKQKWLRKALDDSQNAITTDPSWEKGYYWKAVCLARLDQRNPSFATAAIARYLFPSRCANIPAVVDYFGNFEVHVVKTVQDLQTATEKTDTKAKKLESKNKVVLLEEGEYLLERSVDISEDIVIVGHGKVSIACKTGAPFLFKAAYHVENVEMATDCDTQEESQDCSSNDTEPEVIQFYQGLPTVDSTIYSDREISDRAKSLFEAQEYYAAAEAYSEALRLSPNDAKLLTNRAASYHKLSEQKCSSPEDKQKMLVQALADSQKAITVDPSWSKGYYRKAVSLALLGRRGPSLATAVIARHLFPSRCANISIVVDHFGDYDSHVVKTVQDLQTAIEKIDIKSKMPARKNKVVLIKEGEYLLERSVDISGDIVIVGHGKVSVACKTGEPFHFKAAYHVENVKMATDCDRHEESQECSANDSEPEVIRLATPSGYDNTSNEWKVN